ncbi:YchJ family protein [Alkalimarinus coralli]|uniref:YchJ family protein n=1 Tax=Alkalimarinus coralli TaxID=2935863 RepID=UPI00202AFF42|nr:YchJ family protein [Alkalimarinus coralli]
MSREIECPCGYQVNGNSLTYAECCEPFISGAAKPDRCEQLMRSRYTAYALGKVDYLIATWHPTKQQELDKASLRQSAESTEWLRLQVISSQQQGERGTVEFNAYFKERDASGSSEGKEIQGLHEVSRFEKVGNQWFYLDGDVESAGQTKVGRNDPCPCGSGKKYKKCCG